MPGSKRDEAASESTSAYDGWEGGFEVEPEAIAEVAPAGMPENPSTTTAGGAVSGAAAARAAEERRAVQAAEAFLARAPAAAACARDPRARERAVALARGHQLEVVRLAMNRQLEDPQWYLTGVQVGLASLERLEQVAGLVYRGAKPGSPGLAKLETLRAVREGLAELGACFRADADPSRRAELLIRHREHFVALLADLEQSEPAADAMGEDDAGLSLFARIGRDVQSVTNRLRTYENLGRALRRFAEPPGLSPKARKQREVQIAEFVAAYAPILALHRWDHPSHFAKPADAGEKADRVGELVRRTRRHLAALRDALFQGAGESARDEARPEMDLEVERVLRVLRVLAEGGVAYLERAYGIYEHAVADAAVATSLADYLDRLEARR